MARSETLRAVTVSPTGEGFQKQHHPKAPSENKKTSPNQPVKTRATHSKSQIAREPASSSAAPPPPRRRGQGHGHPLGVCLLLPLPATQGLCWMHSCPPLPGHGTCLVLLHLPGCPCSAARLAGGSLVPLLCTAPLHALPQSQGFNPLSSCGDLTRPWALASPVCLPTPRLPLDSSWHPTLGMATASPAP